MDIKQLEYFVEIVNSKCNLSIASKKLHISQPALSSIIRNFEAEENIRLFERYNGRLQNLTHSGEIFYKNALLILENYQTMLRDLRETSVQYKGKVKIGIPPFILSVAFSDILPAMILDHPDIEFEIVEQGAFELQKALIAKNLDFAVLLQPVEMNHKGAMNEYLLAKSELTAFMHMDTPLAQYKKIAWSQLHDQPIAIFNDSFLIHHHLMNQFNIHAIRPKISITSSCWDFLMLSVRNSNFVTILPSTVSNLFQIPNIVERPFQDPIPWKVALYQAKKSRYSRVEKYVLEMILDHFGVKR